MSKLFVFRIYKKKEGDKKVRHPKLIVDENNEEYGFMGLTSSKYKGRGHTNFELLINPNSKMAGKSYLRKKIEYDNKDFFGEILKDYSLSKKDIERLIPYINKHKKKK